MMNKFEFTAFENEESFFIKLQLIKFYCCTIVVNSLSCVLNLMPGKLNFPMSLHNCVFILNTSYICTYNFNKFSFRALSY